MEETNLTEIIDLVKTYLSETKKPFSFSCQFARLQNCLLQIIFDLPRFREKNGAMQELNDSLKDLKLFIIEFKGTGFSVRLLNVEKDLRRLRQFFVNLQDIFLRFGNDYVSTLVIQEQDDPDFLEDWSELARFLEGRNRLIDPNCGLQRSQNSEKMTQSLQNEREKFDSASFSSNCASETRYVFPDLIPDLTSLNGILDELLKSINPLKELFDSMNWQIPQIVVIGNESSGKSTILERLTTIDAFPQDRSFCTRVPIRLQVRRSQPDKVVVSRRNMLHQEDTEEVKCDLASLKAHVKHMMDTMSIKQLKKGAVQGIDDENEITISIQLPDFPNIDVVDLPGIVVASKPGDDPTLPEKTVSLARRYIEMHKNHSIFLLIVPANTQMNLSAAVRLTQDCDITNQCLGVITMCDTYNPPGITSSQSKNQDLMDYSSGKGPGYIDIEHGWTLTMSRPVSGGNSEYKSSAMLNEEDDWFESNLPDLFALNKYGCRRLVSQIEVALTSYMAHSWCPETIVRLNLERERVVHEIAELGIEVGEFESGDRRNQILYKIHEILSLIDWNGVFNKLAEDWIQVMKIMISSETNKMTGRNFLNSLIVMPSISKNISNLVYAEVMKLVPTAIDTLNQTMRISLEGDMSDMKVGRFFCLLQMIEEEIQGHADNNLFASFRSSLDDAMQSCEQLSLTLECAVQSISLQNFQFVCSACALRSRGLVA